MGFAFHFETLSLFAANSSKEESTVPVKVLHKANVKKFSCLHSQSGNNPT